MIDTVLKLALPAFLLAGCNSSSEVLSLAEPTMPTMPVTQAATGNVTIVQADATYSKLSATDGTPIILGGTAVQFVKDGQSSTVFHDVNGTLVTGQGGAVTITDYAALSDPNGFEQEGTTLSPKYVARQNQDSAVIELLTTGSTYDYMVPYSHERTTSSGRQFGLGIAGVETREVDMPGSGSARFTGDSVAAFADSTGTITSNGRSTINADFAANTVSAEGQFTIWRDSNKDIVANDPFDKIEHENMAITGNTFQGGTNTITNNGSVVDVTGTNTTALTRGNFFGGKIITKNGVQTKSPAEAGGVSVISGDTGAVIHTFFGD